MKRRRDTELGLSEIGLGIIIEKDLDCGHQPHGIDCRQKIFERNVLPRKHTSECFRYEATFEPLRRVFSQMLISNVAEKGDGTGRSSRGQNPQLQIPRTGL